MCPRSLLFEFPLKVRGRVLERGVWASVTGARVVDRQADVCGPWEEVEPLVERNDQPIRFSSSGLTRKGLVLSSSHQQTNVPLIG